MDSQLFDIHTTERANILISKKCDLNQKFTKTPFSHITLYIYRNFGFILQACLFYLYQYTRQSEQLVPLMSNYTGLFINVSIQYRL